MSVLAESKVRVRTWEPLAPLTVLVVKVGGVVASATVAVHAVAPVVVKMSTPAVLPALRGVRVMVSPAARAVVGVKLKVRSPPGMPVIRFVAPVPLEAVNAVELVSVRAYVPVAAVMSPDVVAEKVYVV